MTLQATAAPLTARMSVIGGKRANVRAFAGWREDMLNTNWCRNRPPGLGASLFDLLTMGPPASGVGRTSCCVSVAPAQRQMNIKAATTEAGALALASCPAFVLMRWYKLAAP